ncbi:MAG: hypothetical protein HY778_14540 [Betaproteobacteria bacterium]|nr:hypothetical protein [Betaproteobacteria bacterium]
MGLLLEGRDGLHAVEVKTSRAVSPHLGRTLRAILADTGARTAAVIDQGAGVEPLAAGIEQRGFDAARQWLPG